MKTAYIKIITVVVVILVGVITFEKIDAKNKPVFKKSSSVVNENTIQWGWNNIRLQINYPSNWILRREFTDGSIDKKGHIIQPLNQSIFLTTHDFKFWEKGADIQLSGIEGYPCCARGSWASTSRVIIDRKSKTAGGVTIEEKVFEGLKGDELEGFKLETPSIDAIANVRLKGDNYISFNLASFGKDRRKYLHEFERIIMSLKLITVK